MSGLGKVWNWSKVFQGVIRNDDDVSRLVWSCWSIFPSTCILFSNTPAFEIPTSRRGIDTYLILLPQGVGDPHSQCILNEEHLRIQQLGKKASPANIILVSGSRVPRLSFSILDICYMAMLDVRQRPAFRGVATCTNVCTCVTELKVLTIEKQKKIIKRKQTKNKKSNIQWLNNNTIASGLRTPVLLSIHFSKPIKLRFLQSK